jgi:hypothetical protein
MDTREINRIMKKHREERLEKLKNEDIRLNLEAGYGPTEKAPNGMPAWVQGPNQNVGAKMRQGSRSLVRTPSGLEREQKRASPARTTSSRAQEHEELGGIEEAIRRSELETLAGGARKSKARKSKARKSKARKSKARKSKARKSKARKSKARKK